MCHTQLRAVGTLSTDPSQPRLGLTFSTSVAGCLLGVRFLAMSASNVSYTVEAFNPSLSLTATETLVNPGVAASYVSVFFASGVALAPTASQRVSYRTSTGSYAAVVNAYATTKTTGSLLYLNSWYQYPPYTNPAAPQGPFNNLDYSLEPIFCPGLCPGVAGPSTTTARPTTTSPTTTPAAVSCPAALESSTSGTLSGLIVTFANYSLVNSIVQSTRPRRGLGCYGPQVLLGVCWECVSWRSTPAASLTPWRPST